MCFSFFEHRREKAKVPWLGQSSSHVGWHFDKGVDRPTVGFPRSPVDFQSANCRAHKWNYIRLLAIPVELKMLVPKTFNLDKVPILKVDCLFVFFVGESCGCFSDSLTTLRMGFCDSTPASLEKVEWISLFLLHLVHSSHSSIVSVDKAWLVWYGVAWIVWFVDQRKRPIRMRFEHVAFQEHYFSLCIVSHTHTHSHQPN